ncbi:hypothetical protein GMOD_00006849 [Pyrenophora seminiperda CCB06]|uniref:Uncharacterized protein n=1 Tax=Pyrenophora seminiperda CCB06 TaxID=1302712 RepID=A0A3M7MB16_9PLEO|nr:hypothetical protein GMOD_00006849 [Pyrenophora seminiperda CCB06]
MAVRPWKDISKTLTKQTPEETLEKKVFISGLKGVHSLETGMAYHYRGHYLYCFPSGNPVQPVDQTVKQGRRLIGIARDLAPPYDSYDPKLIQEHEIAALERAQEHFQLVQTEPEVLEKAQDHFQCVQTEPEPPVEASASYTPHDRGHFLAYSAPGSRQASIDNTPFLSGAATPHQGLSIFGHRPAASTSRLNQLLTQEGVGRYQSQLSLSKVEETLSTPKQDLIDSDDMSEFVESVSRCPSRPTLAHWSTYPALKATVEDKPETEELLIPGLGHPDIIRSGPLRTYSPFQQQPQHARAASVVSSVAHTLGTFTPFRSQTPMVPEAETTTFPDFPYVGPSTFSRFNDSAATPKSPSFIPTHTGRPRAASKILNEAYNAANPPMSEGSVKRCTLEAHSESCNGDTVSEAHLTKRFRETTGFKDSLPMLECGDGRVMIDWVWLMGEEAEKMEKEKGKGKGRAA